MAGQSSDLAQVQPKYVQNSATWILSARSWEFDFSYTISSDSTSDGCFLSNVDGKILPALSKVPLGKGPANDLLSGPS